MNVAYVHTGSWPSNSPSTTFTTQNAAALAREFDRCWFFVKRNHEGEPARVFEEEFGASMPEGLDVRSIRPHLDLSNRFFYAQVLKELRRIHRDEGLSVVISRNVTFLPYLAGLRRELGIPVVFESHDFYADLSMRDDIDRAKHRRQERLERLYLPKVTALVCLQEAQKRLYQQAFPGLDIVVARTGIDSFHRRTGPGRYVTYIGSFDEHKGVELLVRAAQHSKTRPPLLIIGGKRAAQIERVEEMARALAPDVSVAVKGWMDKVALRGHLDETAVGVLPLADTFFNRHITSPLKLFDYYGHRIPVVAADLPTLRELVDDGVTGLFHAPGDAADLARALDELLSSADLRERMSRSIYTECEKYLWSERARQLAEFVRGLNRS